MSNHILNENSNYLAAYKQFKMQKCIEHIRNVGIKNVFLRDVVFKLIFDILRILIIHIYHFFYIFILSYFCFIM